MKLVVWRYDDVRQGWSFGGAEAVRWSRRKAHFTLDDLSSHQYGNSSNTADLGYSIRAAIMLLHNFSTLA